MIKYIKNQPDTKIEELQKQIILIEVHLNNLSLLSRYMSINIQLQSEKEKIGTSNFNDKKYGYCCKLAQNMENAIKEAGVQIDIKNKTRNELIETMAIYDIETKKQKQNLEKLYQQIKHVEENEIVLGRAKK